MFCLNSKELPKPEKGVHVANELDLLMAKNRAAELSSIVEMAAKLRTSATDVIEALTDVEGYLNMLKNMAIEVTPLLHLAERVALVVGACAHTHTDTHACTHAYTHTCTHTHKHTHTHTHTHTHSHSL